MLLWAASSTIGADQLRAAMRQLPVLPPQQQCCEQPHQAHQTPGSTYTCLAQAVPHICIARKKGIGYKRRMNVV